MPAQVKQNLQKPALADARTTPSAPNRLVTDDDLLRLHFFMRLMREFEHHILRLYQQGKIIGGAYSGNGNEATAVGTAYALKPNDYLLPMHRDLGAHFVKGQSVLNMLLQYLGRADALTHGRDGTGHYSDPKLRIYGNISHLGAMVPVACGMALASKLRNERAVAMTYIGDGGSNVGEVHEGLAMASVMKLPLVLIIENNQYAYSTPTSKQFSVEKLSTRASGYGIPGVTIDGTDVLEVYRVSLDAVERARRGEGPTLIETVTMRMHGHAAHDTAWYVPADMMKEWKQRDPVESFERKLLAEGIVTKEKLGATLSDIRKQIEEASRNTESRPYPRGDEANLGVYA